MNANSDEQLTLTQAVEVTLNNIEIEARDVGIATLALELAQRIEREKSNRTAAELSGKLTTVLQALGATPEARKQTNGGAQVVIGKLAQQRALRAGNG